MQQLTDMARDVSALLKEKQATIAVAESSTGGLISAALLAVPGASAYFKGGGVIYTREARSALLGLPPEQVTMRGATEEYALIVARAMREKMGTIWCLAETGASGPSGNRYGDDAGHCCFAVAGPLERSATLETGLPHREENMWRFAAAALELLRKTVNEAG